MEMVHEKGATVGACGFIHSKVMETGGFEMERRFCTAMSSRSNVLKPFTFVKSAPKGTFALISSSQLSSLPKMLQ